MGNSCTKTDDAADAEGRVTQPSSHTQSSPHRRSHVQPAQRMSRSGSVDVVGDEGGSRGQPQPSELTRVPVLPASSAGMKGPSRTGGVQSPPRVASVHSIASATDPTMEQSNHLSHSKRSTIQPVDDGQVSLGSDTAEGARDRFSVSTATAGSLTGPTTGTSAQGASPTRSAAQPQAARRENQATLSPSSPKLASPATAEGVTRYQSGSGTAADEGGGGGAQHQSLLRQDTTFTSNNDTAQPVAASSQVSFGGATLGDVPLITLADCDPGEESNRPVTPRPALATEAVEAMDKGMSEEIGAEQLLQSWLDEQLAVRVRRTPFPKGKNQSLSVSTSQRAGNHVGTLSVSSLYGLSGGEASGSTSHQAATAGAGAVMTQPSGMASRLASLADELVAEISSDKRRAAAAAPAPSFQHSPKQSTDPPPPPPQQSNQLPAEAFGDQSFAESFSVSPNTSHLQPKRRDVTEVILRNVNRRRSSGAPAVSSSGSVLAGHPQGQGDSRAIIPRPDHNNFLDPAADGLGLGPSIASTDYG